MEDSQTKQYLNILELTKKMIEIKKKLCEEKNEPFSVDTNISYFETLVIASLVQLNVTIEETSKRIEDSLFQLQFVKRVRN